MNAVVLNSPIGATSREAMSIPRVLRAYLVEAKFDFLSALRAPIFVIPFLVLPVALFLLFGVVMTPPEHAAEHAKAADAGLFLLAAFSSFAILGPSLFGVGCPIAVERDAGLLKLKRALPAPPGSYLIAKVLMQLAFAAIGVTAVAIMAGLTGKLTMSLSQLCAYDAVLVAGTIPICAIGLFIGTHASGTAAPGLTNLIFFPMMYLSGMFFPLPKFLQPWAIVWPTFHLNQVAFAAAGITQFRFFEPLMSLAALIGVTVLFGGLALRRLARVG
jgi:ABC-2 type transport system permease protein